MHDRIDLPEGRYSHLLQLDVSKCADTTLIQTILLWFHVVSLSCRSSRLAGVLLSEYLRQVCHCSSSLIDFQC